jgi:translation initiation factor 2 subunit 2
MADTEEAPTFDPSMMKKKSRKSVAFAGGEEAGGVVTNGAEQTAETPEGDNDVAELTEKFQELKKKKKSSSSTNENGDGAYSEFDPSLMKKKKKKIKEPTTTDSFDAQLAEAGLLPRNENGNETPEAPAKINPEDAGDLIAGTGVWNSQSTVELTYPLLLTRFFTLLRTQHPDLAGDGRRSYKIPPPQVLREGNKKTIFANISDICKRMKRNDEHVTQFLFAELGTSGSVDGSKRLVIRGKFQQKQLENVLRRYILEYVTCRTCKSPDTDLKKGENRLFFVTCNSCGSRRSVAAIKTGFQATVGKRRRQKA